MIEASQCCKIGFLLIIHFSGLPVNFSFIFRKKEKLVLQKYIESIHLVSQKITSVIRHFFYLKAAILGLQILTFSIFPNHILLWHKNWGNYHVIYGIMVGSRRGLSLLVHGSGPLWDKILKTTYLSSIFSWRKKKGKILEDMLNEIIIEISPNLGEKKNMDIYIQKELKTQNRPKQRHIAAKLSR